jgi:hypothetical protein
MDCNADWEPRAFGGGVLKGGNVTKFVHMDESGISHGEPVCAEAAVIIDADKQWKKVEIRLAELLAEIVPFKHSREYIFHAHKIFHGTDDYFSRKRFPNPIDRARVVRQIAGIVIEFDLPVVVGYAIKDEFPRLAKRSRSHAATQFHSRAYLACALGVEAWMRKNAQPDEVAMLFVENNNQSKETLRIMHKVHSISGLVGEIPAFRAIAAFQRIIEMPNFTEKSESSLLQIADACAFAFTRMMRLGAHWEIISEGLDFKAHKFPEAG